MEPIAVLGAIIVVFGGIWSLADLLRAVGIEPHCVWRTAGHSIRRSTARAGQACSALRSRDISSSTACRAGLSQ